MKNRIFTEEHKKKISLNHADFSGDKNGRWNGGQYKHRGYIYQYSPEHPKATKIGYVMQHRLVMEKIIGRYLKNGEIVHHLNGIKDDNRPENLKLMILGDHSKLHNSGKKQTKEFKEKRLNLLSKSLKRLWKSNKSYRIRDGRGRFI